MGDFQGKRNIYTCEACHGHIVTWDRDAGVTPFKTGCHATEGCKGLMKSSLYRVFDQTMRPGSEWYRPESLDGLSPAARDHVERGGLLLRPYDGPNPPAAERDPPPKVPPVDADLAAKREDAIKAAVRSVIAP
jgi:hypothetical protein